MALFTIKNHIIIISEKKLLENNEKVILLNKVKERKED